MRPIGPIYYEAMRGRWSRVLERASDGTAVVNLTPLGGDKGDWQTTVAPIVVRRHHMTPHPNDLFLSQLPREIFDWVGERIGTKKRHFLLTSRIVAMVDWERYRAQQRLTGRADVPLELCCLPHIDLRMSA